MDTPSLRELGRSDSDSSPLARARIRGTLTVEQAAEAAGVTADAARWLEQGRLYRFADADAAIAATIAYAGAVGALEEHARDGVARAARRARSPRRRALVVTAIAVAAVGVAATIAAALAERDGSGTSAGAAPGVTRVAAGAGGGAAASAAPATSPAAVVVDTIDAAGRPTAARALAVRLTGLGYRVGRVTSAGRRDEPDTAVYFEPGGAAAGARLARSLDLPSRPLPGGSDPRRLVVVVGRRGLGA